MELGDADAVALDRGANLALIGGELVQFERAEPIGGSRWRLTQLLRGRRGTEAAAVQGAGDRFVLLEEDAVRAIDLPLSAIGCTIRVLASGIGDPEPVEAQAVLGGASVVPPSPVGLRAILSETGDALVTWVRRSRAGWRWIDGVDAPLGEESEAYRVTIAAGETTRTVETGVANVVVTAAERDGPVSVTIRQRGTFGESPPATIMVPEREDI